MVSTGLSCFTWSCTDFSLYSTQKDDINNESCKQNTWKPGFSQSSCTYLTLIKGLKVNSSAKVEGIVGSPFSYLS